MNFLKKLFSMAASDEGYIGLSSFTNNSRCLEDKKEEIYERIDSIADKGLSEKEMLIEAFKIINGDENLLISKIDEVLAQKEEKKRGIAA